MSREIFKQEGHDRLISTVLGGPSVQLYSLMFVLMSAVNPASRCPSVRCRALLPRLNK